MCDVKVHVFFNVICILHKYTVYIFTYMYMIYVFFKYFKYFLISAEDFVHHRCG